MLAILFPRREYAPKPRNIAPVPPGIPVILNLTATLVATAKIPCSLAKDFELRQCVLGVKPNEAERHCLIACKCIMLWRRA